MASNWYQKYNYLNETFQLQALLKEIWKLLKSSWITESYLKLTWKINNSIRVN